MDDVGFAVLDLETTGLFAEGTDRIAEVAVVHLDGRGRITGTWQTLVNPKRDLGPQSVHGIRAADVLSAPAFEQIAGTLVGLLRGRVLAGHNIAFDHRFLAAEFRRIGVTFPLAAEETLCTMRLANLFLPGAGRSLRDCCSAFDIELVGAHDAGADARATAALLGAYLHQDRGHPVWRELPRLANRAWPDLPVHDIEPRRRSGDEPQPHFLERIVDRLPEQSGPAEHLEYLALLDRCLLDRRLSAHEGAALVDLAHRLGIERSACARIHRLYFDRLAETAWADRVLTTFEGGELRTVASLLAIPDPVLAAALVGPPPRNVAVATGWLEETRESRALRLAAGDRIVLTGEMKRPREAWEEELLGRGFVPWPSVTKKVKLVAAADPDSLSGKARKARDYGIPIVDEAGLEALLGR